MPFYDPENPYDRDLDHDITRYFELEDTINPPPIIAPTTSPDLVMTNPPTIAIITSPSLQ